MAGLPGSFGKYFLCEKIAAGGMAEIYLAKLIGPGGFEKQLVVKQISPELSRERRFVELFVAEAKTLVSLSHGNIVPVYELGVVDDTYFIAMEYVDGPPLGEVLAALEARGERLEPAVAAHVAGELCKGLDYAHRKGEGVVHRDLSPRNVLLSREGEVKLVDFGLAVAADRAQQGPPGAGHPAGSFPYMSPEQVRREPLDARSDLFSLGVLLWEMLTGERLFARGDPDSTLEAVLSAPIAPPSQRRAEVPAELDRICLRALDRDRDRRYATAGEILTALARFVYSVEPPVTQASLAALVARICPPVARREDGSQAEASEPARPVVEGEATRPTGTRRASRHPESVRTFATSAQFSEALANATPLMPFPALGDAAARRMAELAPRGKKQRALAAPPAAAPTPVERRRAGRWAVLAIAGAAGIAAIALLTREGARSSDARPPDARAADEAITSTRPVPPATGTSAGDPPATGTSAGPRTPRTTGTSTAPRTPLATGTSTAPSDPGRATRASAPAAAPTGATATDPAAPGKDRRARGRGTLQVGANPWADVYVDGALLGQAPGAWPIAAGPHAVEVRHRDQRRTFRVAIEPGETESLGLVDFSAP